jgi:hypothetical protein
VPLAVNMSEERERMEEEAVVVGRQEQQQQSSPHHHHLPMEQTSETEQSPVKSLKEGSRAMSLSPGGEKDTCGRLFINIPFSCNLGP